MAGPGHVLSYDVPLGGDGDAWTHSGDYSIWTRGFGPQHAALTLFQHRDGREVVTPDKAYALHNVAAGIPHRIAGLFGFWRTSDGDTVFLKTTTAQGTSYALIVNTGSQAYHSDRVSWICRRCEHPLDVAVFPTRRFGVAAFWDEAGRLVKAFNADSGRRTCGRCTTEHPFAYGFFDA